MRRRAAILLSILFTCATCGAARADVTKPPRLTTFVEADYPADKKAAGIIAVVRLRIAIAADGRVEGVTLVESGGAEFDAAAIAAARRFVFAPAEVDGKPAPVKIEYRYAFTLRVEPPKPTPTPKASLEGVVLERGTRRPLAAVTVTLADLGLTATTDAAGRFAFADVAPGAHTVRLTAASLFTVTTEESIAAGKRARVEYVVEEKPRPAPRAGPRALEADEEEVVRAPRLRAETTEIAITAEEGRRVPGTQGDTLKVVQNLPGVARAPLGSGQLVVWGSAPADTRVYVDGVEIPALYHGSALRSVIHSDLVRSIDLVPGAFGAEYGRGLGGLVRVETRALPVSGVHGSISADTLDASAMASAAVTDRLRVAAAARYSYLDRVLAATSAPDVGDFFPIPRYRDYQAKATLALRKDETLDAVFLGSNDELRRTLPAADPGASRSESTTRSFHRAYFRYARLLEDGTSLTVTPFAGYDEARLNQAFGAVPARLDVGTWRYGMRASYRAKLAPEVTLMAGLDLLGSKSELARSGSLTLPPREGDVLVFGQPPGDDVNADAWSTHVMNVGPYLATEVTLGRLTVTPGVRFDAFLIEGSRLTPRVGQTPAIGFSRLEGSVDPRLAVRYDATSRLALSASGGAYHQAPQPEELSAVFGTPELALSSATHVSAGESLKITESLSLDATAFYKSLSDLAVRSRLPTPKLGRAIVQDGEGRSFGLQVLLRQKLWKGFFGWASYALSRSERRYVGEERWRLFDFDQPHVLSLVASQELGTWTFGARARYATGFPRTPVAAAYYDARGDQYQPVFGEQNTTRLPDFFQLDLRAEKAFKVGVTKWNVFLELQNVTFQKNREEIVYSFDFTRRGYITGLPTLAVAGFRLEL